MWVRELLQVQFPQGSLCSGEWGSAKLALCSLYSLPTFNRGAGGHLGACQGRGWTERWERETEDWDAENVATLRATSGHQTWSRLGRDEEEPVNWVWFSRAISHVYKLYVYALQRGFIRMAYSPHGLGSPTMVLFSLESLRNYCTGYKTVAPAVPIWHGGSEGVREDRWYSIQNICLLVLSRSNILVIYTNQETKRGNVATNKFSNHRTTINNSENKEGNIAASWKVHSRKRPVPSTVLCPRSRDKQIWYLLRSHSWLLSCCNQTRWKGQMCPRVVVEHQLLSVFHQGVFLAHLFRYTKTIT